MSVLIRIKDVPKPLLPPVPEGNTNLRGLQTPIMNLSNLSIDMDQMKTFVEGMFVNQRAASPVSHISSQNAK